jgi:hypothetical protein
MANAP